MGVERGVKIFQRVTIERPDGYKETTETQFARVKPYGKERTTRSRQKKSLITDGLLDSYQIVEAAILGQLTVNSPSQTGEYPFAYGEMGGDDTPQNALALLNKGGVTDEKIVKEFMRIRPEPEFRKDESAQRLVMSALQSIRSVNSTVGD